MIAPLFSSFFLPLLLWFCSSSGENSEYGLTGPKIAAFQERHAEINTMEMS